MFGKEWKPDWQKQRMKVACRNARLEPINFHGLRHTWASLRGHGRNAADRGRPQPRACLTKMVEKHYGHLAQSYVVDQVRKFAPRFRQGGVQREGYSLAYTGGN